jgi:hypothetical protein
MADNKTGMRTGVSLFSWFRLYDEKTADKKLAVFRFQKSERIIFFAEKIPISRAAGV